MYNVHRTHPKCMYYVGLKPVNNTAIFPLSVKLRCTSMKCVINVNNVKNILIIFFYFSKVFIIVLKIGKIDLKHFSLVCTQKNRVGLHKTLFWITRTK